jgi:hypothetical protein
LLRYHISLSEAVQNPFDEDEANQAMALHRWRTVLEGSTRHHNCLVFDLYLRPTVQSRYGYLAVSDCLYRIVPFLFSLRPRTIGRCALSRPLLYSLCRGRHNAVNPFGTEHAKVEGA